MKFAIQQDSSIPVHVQIKERIKTALLFGELRPGDTLPSIRDLEQELGIGRAIVRRAYLELEECGILDIRHGRRVSINEYLQIRADHSVTKELETLVDETLRRARKLGVSHSSFAKLLLIRAMELDRKQLSYLFVDTSKALADEIARQISRMWEVPISGASLAELPELLRSEDHQIHRIIVTYYRYDEVSALVKRLQKREHAEVVPVSVRFTEDMMKQINSLPSSSKVLLVAEDNEYRRHGKQPFADAYTELFGEHDVEFAVRPASSFADLKQIATRNGYALTIVSNSIWDRLPPVARKTSSVTHPRFEVDRTSLEQARISAGVIV
jgi:DNA-binding transcriptional regulator YhcF (GntR family)